MDNLLNTKQASKYLGLSEKTLTNSRWSGVGVCVPFIKLGSAVKYRQFELDKYIEEHTFTHTGEAKKSNK